MSQWNVVMKPPRKCIHRIKHPFRYQNDRYETSDCRPMLRYRLDIEWFELEFCQITMPNSESSYGIAH